MTKTPLTRYNVVGDPRPITEERKMAYKTTEFNTASPVSALPGVGPAKQAAYKKIGVSTLGDLINHVPRAYENRGEIRPLDCSRDDGKTAVVLTVCTPVQSSRLRGGKTVIKFRASDDSGLCDLVFFNQPYLKGTFVTGSVWRFWGKVERRLTRNGMRYSMSSPVYERWEPGMLQDFTPVYPLTEGLTQKQIARDIAETLRLLSPQITDILPQEIISKYRLCTLAYALRNIHNPENFPALAAAKRRLVFDELFTFSLLVARQGMHRRETGAFPCVKQNISPLLSLLPFELTEAQKRCVREIAADMKTDVRMSRILIGDVGSGKTAVAAAAICICLMNGRQAALMAPTEILASQHYSDLSPVFEKLGFRCALLTGSVSAAQKKKIKAGLSADGEEKIDLVIGTHALLTEDVAFSSLSLIVTDEQHRFGVEQRAALAEKGLFPHMLSMSATPIPRSLALVLYGDLDISRIDEMPPGRQKTDTYLVDESKRARVNAFIERTVADGGQVYVVCPSIDEQENETYDSGEVGLDEITESGLLSKPPLKAAKVYAEQLRQTLPGLTVALIHGRMKAAEKEAVMTGFVAGDINVLVSTTVIEVGVNVANASLMIIENAERFGLSQLHQLRGRVGRGKRKSCCILISDDSSASSHERLSVMCETNNGFEIAEADLRTRGPGDFIAAHRGDAIRQSGGFKFRLADVSGDAGAFACATEAAREIITTDPDLSAHPLLKDYIDKTAAAGTITD